jgi:hypothetical protein
MTFRHSNAVHAASMRQDTAWPFVNLDAVRLRLVQHLAVDRTVEAIVHPMALWLRMAAYLEQVFEHAGSLSGDEPAPDRSHRSHRRSERSSLPPQFDQFAGPPRDHLS